MPLGGSTISWDASTPAGTESIGLGDDRIRSMKTSVQEALDNEHNFPAAGGASTGYHKLGSARAHVGTQSRVSSGDTDGRLMIASDTSNFFAPMSAGTVLVGGMNTILVGPDSSLVSAPQRFYWAIESGAATTNGATAETIVTFANSGFSTAPIIVVGGTNVAFINHTSRTTSVIFQSFQTTGGSAVSSGGVGVRWLALGHRIL